MTRKVEVTPYNPLWKEQFLHEKKRLNKVFQRDNAIIHHIGSTSVEGLAAKPIIDFLIEVPDISTADERTPELETLGYEAKGENGIPNRRYFFMENEQGIRLFHVHIFPSGSEEVMRHLVFRDYLRTFKDEAEKYGRIKSDLAAKHPTNINAYIEGKNNFVQEMEKRAMEWKRDSLG
ncbi:GrpB family protein [Bacillus sp. AK031]